MKTPRRNSRKHQPQFTEGFWCSSGPQFRDERTFSCPEKATSEIWLTLSLLLRRKLRANTSLTFYGNLCFSDITEGKHAFFKFESRWFFILICIYIIYFWYMNKWPYIWAEKWSKMLAAAGNFKKKTVVERVKMRVALTIGKTRNANLISLRSS